MRDILRIEIRDPRVIRGSRLGSHACIIAELNYLRSHVGERVPRTPCSTSRFSHSKSPRNNMPTADSFKSPRYLLKQTAGRANPPCLHPYLHLDEADVQMSQPSDGVPPRSRGAAYQPVPTRLASLTLLFSVEQTIGQKTDHKQLGHYWTRSVHMRVQSNQEQSRRAQLRV